jgi:hypothetical protein
MPEQKKRNQDTVSANTGKTTADKPLLGDMETSWASKSHLQLNKFPGSSPSLIGFVAD